MLKNFEIPILYQKSFIYKILFNLIKNFSQYIRWNINIQTFLYKSAKTNIEKKRRLKKLNRKNNAKRFLIINILRIFINESPNKTNHDTRPQHLFKIAEFKSDLFNLIKNKKKKEILNKEILCLYEKSLRAICSFFYNDIGYTVNYFIIIEFYFSVFYYLQQVHKINIQRY